MKGRAVVILFGSTTELRESVYVGIRLNAFEFCSSQ